MSLRFRSTMMVRTSLVIQQVGNFILAIIFTDKNFLKTFEFGRVPSTFIDEPFVISFKIVVVSICSLTRRIFDAHVVQRRFKRLAICGISNAECFLDAHFCTIRSRNYRHLLNAGTHGSSGNSPHISSTVKMIIHGHIKKVISFIESINGTVIAVPSKTMT